MKLPDWTWLADYISPYQIYMYGIKKHLFSGKTDYQQVEIVDTFSFGRCLILDGKIQSARLDEELYHELLVHPAMGIHPAPRKIAVLGGGEGAVLRELFRYGQVDEVVMIDIDRKVVEMCREHLPEWHQGAFDDRRLELVFGDARRYIEETERKFDIIISDLTEPVDDGPSYLLYTTEFYQTLRQRLNPGGILAMQAGSFNPVQLEGFAAIRNTLNQFFKYVRPYHVFIPSFDADWGFILAANDQKCDPLSLSKADVDSLWARQPFRPECYDGETHQCIFAIPRHVRAAIDKEKRIISDGNPVFVN